MATSASDKEAPRPQEVFISYSRKDKEFVRRLDEALQTRGREAWVDWEGIRPTEEFMQAIYGAIEGADTFVFVLTPDSVASEVCAREIAHAAAHNKRMVPIVARDVDAKAVPEPLAKLNWIFSRASDDFEAAAGSLVSALDTDLEWVHAHTRLLTRAIEWEANKKSNSFVLRGEDLRSAEQWLAQAGTEKERQPTALQTEYIIASRRASSRRLRMFLGIAVAVVVITILLAAVATIQRGIAVKRTREVSQSLSRSDLLEATRRLAANEVGAALAHLARALRVDPENGIAQRRLIALLSQRDWQFPALDPLVQSDFVWSADISPDGKRIVTSCGMGIVQLWDAERGERVGEMLRCPSLATATFSGDGSKIAVTCELNVGEPSVRGRWQVLDGATGKPLADAAERLGSIAAAAFTGDGKQLLIGLRVANGAGEVCASDAVKGAPPQTLVSWTDAAPEAFDAAGARVIALEREHSAAAEGQPKIARVWNLRTGKPATLPFKHDEEIAGAIFSPDGDHIATWTGLKARAFVWDLAADRLAFSTGPVADDLLLSHIAYSPDAKLLLAAHVQHPTREMDWAVQVHDAKTGEPVRGEIRDHGRFSSAVFSPDSQFLLLCSSRQSARIWRARSGGESELEEAVAPLEHADVVRVAKMTPDGRRIVTGSFDKTLRIWEATPGLGRALPDTLPSAQPVYFAEMSPRGKRIATVSAEPAGLQFWDAATRQPVSQFLPLSKMPYAARFSSDAQLLIVGGEDGIARVWDASSGRPVAQLTHPSGKSIEAAVLNSNGTHAVTATSSETLLWDVGANRASPLVVAPSQQRTPGVEFTPDGARLLTIGEGEMSLWNVATGEPVWGPIAHSGASTQARFSPDGKRFAVFGVDSAVDLFDSATGKLEHALSHRGRAVDAVFSADGRIVATCSLVLKTSGYAQAWDAATGTAITQPLVGEDELHHVGLSPDGMLICATERSGRVRIWSIATGRECIDPLPHDTSAFPTWFSSDGKRLLTVTGGAAQFHELWDLGGPAPSWLADLSEAVGGLAVNESGVAVAVQHRRQAFEKVRGKITEGSGDDPRLKWARWFFADRRTRNISPFSQRTMREELGHKP